MLAIKIYPLHLSFTRGASWSCLQIVHGGIMALTFDNLCGWALFLQGAGAVVTAYLKVTIPQTFVGFVFISAGCVS